MVVHIRTEVPRVLRRFFAYGTALIYCRHTGAVIPCELCEMIENQFFPFFMTEDNVRLLFTVKLMKFSSP